MAWIADSRLAAAVSEAGGLGLISSINGGVEAVRAEIRKARELTCKPFGVNIMLASPDAAQVADLVVEEGIGIVTTGAGSPAPYMEKWKAAGIKVIPVVASVAYAVKMQELGATAVVAEGAESGGHVGDTHTLALFLVRIAAIEPRHAFGRQKLRRPLKCHTPLFRDAIHAVREHGELRSRRRPGTAGAAARQHGDHQHARCASQHLSHLHCSTIPSLLVSSLEFRVSS